MTFVSKSGTARSAVPDFIRGITIVSMVLYHAMWDLIYMFGPESGMAAHASWYEGWPGYLWQQSICWTFILLSGYCVRFSRNPVKRGLIVLSCGVAVSVVTTLVLPEAAVRFGVLTFLGSAMIVAGVVRVVLGKCFRGRNGSKGTGTDDPLKKMGHCTCPFDPFFTFLGRHSLLIYMLHQVVLYGIFYLIFCAF